MIKKCTGKNNLYEIEYILNNIRNEDKQELYTLWEENWKENVIKSLEDKNFFVLYGKNNFEKSVPIAMGGFVELFEKDTSIACVWLISSVYINKNKKIFVKELKKQISIANDKYKIMYNFIYISNKEAKKWLKKLGFKFNNPNPKEIKLAEGFEFFYKCN